MRPAERAAWGSPLLEVERAVQERAKAMTLDMGRPEGRATLRALLDDEIRRWGEDVKRGTRSFDLANPAGVAERAWRNLAGYGPLEPLLADPDVWEIMINAPDHEYMPGHDRGHQSPVRRSTGHHVRPALPEQNQWTGTHRYS